MKWVWDWRNLRARRMRYSLRVFLTLRQSFRQPVFLISTCLCVGIAFLFLHEVLLTWKTQRPGRCSLTPSWVSNCRQRRNKTASPRSAHRKSKREGSEVPCAFIWFLTMSELVSCFNLPALDHASALRPLLPCAHQLLSKEGVGGP